MVRLGFLDAGDDLRSRAVDALRLRRGATVIDLCTGTGSSLPYLAAAVRVEGRVVGIDISPGMLDRARRRCESLRQVELVEADAARLPFATAALTPSSLPTDSPPFLTLIPYSTRRYVSYEVGGGWRSRTPPP